MIFLEYERAKRKYLQAQERLEIALTEHEKMIAKTMPNAIRYDRVSVQHDPDSNILDEYVIELEEKKIANKITALKQILFDRESLLKLKEKELRHSTDKMDRIYCLKYLESKNPNTIAKSMNYSLSQIYRKIDRIQKEIRKII